MLAQVMPFHEKHSQGIEFFVAIDDTDEVSWISLCKDLSSEIKTTCRVKQVVLTAKTYLSAGWRRSLSCSWAMSSKREGLRA